MSTATIWWSFFPRRLLSIKIGCLSEKKSVICYIAIQIAAESGVYILEKVISY